MKKNRLKKYAKTAISLSCLWMVIHTSDAQTKKDREQIQQKYNKQEINQLKNQLAEEGEQRKEEALRKAKDEGWAIQIMQDDGNMMELQGITDEGTPLYYTTYNRGAGITTRANRLYSGGGLGLTVHGENMIAGVWDGGPVRPTHQLFSNRTTQRDNLVFTSPNGNNNHATHVTGTIIGSDQVDGGASRGMAFKASAWTYDWNNDLSEAVNAANDGLLLSNHSYGLVADNLPKYFFGKYTRDARSWDQIMNQAPNYLMVVAAGNDRRSQANLTNKGGFDLLTGHSCSKNNIVVAAVNQVTNYTGPNSVVMSNFSNWGPTDDGRIKPDISAKGVNVRSSTSYGNSTYASLSGTSMASPNATGTLLLLQQHYKEVNGDFMRSSTLRGLALHTADEAGNAPGPDYRYGWGLLNAAKAAQTISDNGTGSFISEEVLSNGGVYTKTVTSNNIDDLMVTICWIDPAGNVLSNVTDLRTASLVNDLDVRVTKGNSTFSPWRLNPANPAAAATKGDNKVDNIEKVEIQNASGVYTIRVSHKGSLQSGNQAFSIIVTGISEQVVCNALIPSNLSTENITSNSIDVNWSLVQGASYDVRYRKQGTTSWTIKSANENEATLNNLEDNTTYEIQVRSKCNQSVSGYSNTITAKTSEFTVSYCDAEGRSASDEYISSVQLNTILNNSGAKGYSDFTSINTSLAKGISYTINLTPTWSGTVYNEGYAVWIDYNGDGDFTDNNERVWISSPSRATSLEGSFTIPSTAKLGATRMRIAMKYNAIPTSCESFQFGEVEDYTVVIKAEGGDNVAPSVPSGLTSSNIEETSFILSWNASTDNVSVTGYDIYQNNTLIGSSNGTTVRVTGLLASTTYSFSVVAKDAAGNSSAKSATISVTTKGAVVTYCESSGEKSNFEWIDYVELGGMTNATGANDGYGDFTNKIARINYGQNRLLVSAGFRSTAYTEFWKIWIDYNKDGVFSNSEIIGQGSSSNANNLSATFTVPNTAQAGETRMRVSMKYNEAQTACESFEFGEVEDYTVVIGASDVNVSVVLNTGNTFDDEKASTIFIVPNPVTSSFAMTGTIKEGNYTLIDMSGNVVSEGYINANDQVDVTHLSNGVYTIQLNDGQKLFTEKLIISK